jgi:hypothetical protein
VGAWSGRLERETKLSVGFAPLGAASRRHGSARLALEHRRCVRQHDFRDRAWHLVVSVAAECQADAGVVRVRACAPTRASAIWSKMARRSSAVVEVGVERRHEASPALRQVERSLEGDAAVTAWIRTSRHLALAFPTVDCTQAPRHTELFGGRTSPVATRLRHRTTTHRKRRHPPISRVVAPTS